MPIPPHTTIWLPVHTATCMPRAAGAPVVFTAPGAGATARLDLPRGALVEIDCILYAG